MHIYTLGSYLVSFALISQNMSGDEPGPSDQPVFKGFRKRWAENPPRPADDEQLSEVGRKFSQKLWEVSSAGQGETFSLPGSWDNISEGMPAPGGSSQYEPESPIDDLSSDHFPRVLDPDGRELTGDNVQWQQSARERE